MSDLFLDFVRITDGLLRTLPKLHVHCIKLQRKTVKFEWTDECSKAFDTLKTALTTAPILGYPTPNSKFVLDTDASDKATGAVLSQIQNGQEIVIAYHSKSLNKHEQNYCVTRKELLAVIHALNTFHHYLYGQPVLLRTDNAAVSWMRNLKRPTGQVARWLETLGTYNLIVTHRAGSSHGNADALSRSPCSKCATQESRNTTSDDSDDCSESEVCRVVPNVSETGIVPSTSLPKFFHCTRCNKVPDQVKFHFYFRLDFFKYRCSSIE